MERRLAWSETDQSVRGIVSDHASLNPNAIALTPRLNFSLNRV